MLQTKNNEVIISNSVLAESTQKNAKKFFILYKTIAGLIVTAFVLQTVVLFVMQIRNNSTLANFLLQSLFYTYQTSIFAFVFALCVLIVPNFINKSNEIVILLFSQCLVVNLVTWVGIKTYHGDSLNIVSEILTHASYMFFMSIYFIAKLFDGKNKINLKKYLIFSWITPVFFYILVIPFNFIPYPWGSFGLSYNYITIYGWFTNFNPENGGSLLLILGIFVLLGVQIGIGLFLIAVFNICAQENSGLKRKKIRSEDMLFSGAYIVFSFIQTFIFLYIHVTKIDLVASIFSYTLFIIETLFVCTLIWNIVANFIRKILNKNNAIVLIIFMYNLIFWICLLTDVVVKELYFPVFISIYAILSFFVAIFLFTYNFAKYMVDGKHVVIEMNFTDVEELSIEFKKQKLFELLKKAKEKGTEFLFLGEHFLNNIYELKWNYEQDKNIALKKSNKIIKEIKLLTWKLNMGVGFGYYENDEDKIFSSYMAIYNGRTVCNQRKISYEWMNATKTEAEEKYGVGTKANSFYLKSVKTKISLGNDAAYFPDKFKSKNGLVICLCSKNKKDFSKEELVKKFTIVIENSQGCLFLNSCFIHENIYGGYLYFNNGKIENTGKENSDILNLDFNSLKK